MDIQTMLLTVGPIAWGLVCKYHPAWKGVPNALIPYATFAAAFLTKLAAPEAAHAATFAAMPAGVLAVGGVAGHALAAGWQAILNSLIYEVFLRHPVGAVLQKQ